MRQSTIEKYVVLGVVVHTSDCSTWEVEAGLSRVQGKSQQYSEFKDSLDVTVKAVENGVMKRR